MDKIVTRLFGKPLGIAMTRSFRCEAMGDQCVVPTEVVRRRGNHGNCLKWRGISSSSQLVSQLDPNIFETHNPTPINLNEPAGQNDQVTSQVVRDFFVTYWYQPAILDVFKFVPQSGGLTHPVPSVNCKPHSVKMVCRTQQYQGPAGKLNLSNISRANPPSSFVL